MTEERDFDRLARAWLELGPDKAPDRAIAAVLQAVETTPQVRSRPWRLPTLEVSSREPHALRGHRGRGNPHRRRGRVLDQQAKHT